MEAALTGGRFCTDLRPPPSRFHLPYRQMAKFCDDGSEKNCAASTSPWLFIRIKTAYICAVPTKPDTKMKRLLLAVLLISLVGTGAELLLLEHTEDWWQLVPIVLIGFGLAALVWFEVSGSRVSKQFFRTVLVFFIVSGVLGFVLHYQGNMEFELEMYPKMKGGELVWETLKGATPVLAPGTMIATGLLGWAYTLR